MICRAKLRKNAKVREVYKFGKTLGTGGKQGSCTQHFAYSRILPPWLLNIDQAPEPCMVVQHVRCIWTTSLTLQVTTSAAGIHSLLDVCSSLMLGVSANQRCIFRGHVSLDAGFAVVKLATDRSSGEEYAVKIMALPEPNAKAGDNENTRYRLINFIVCLQCHLHCARLQDVKQLHLQRTVMLLVVMLTRPCQPCVCLLVGRMCACK